MSALLKPIYQPGWEREAIAARLARKPFIPASKLANGHVQTILGRVIKRRPRLLEAITRERIFQVAPGVGVLGKCSWQSHRTLRPTVLILHGLEGSADSPYMVGLATKAMSAGFNVIRLNQRNCGGTERLTSTLYHAGLSEDIPRILSELMERDGLRDFMIIGVSLGGNIALKVTGQYGHQARSRIMGVVAISPAIDVAATIEALELRSNLIYHLLFMQKLRRHMRVKARLFPNLYDESLLRGVWSIRKFDEVYTAPSGGFRGLAEYYGQASSRPLLKRIEIPTLIIHARDDPFIPFTIFEGREIDTNPNIILLAPDHGGHVGFISARPEDGSRFWAESRAIEFLALLKQ